MDCKMELSSEKYKDPMMMEEKQEPMMMEEKQEPMMMEEKQEPMTMEEKQEPMMIEEAPTFKLRSVIDNYRYRVEEEVALKIPIIRARFKAYNTKMKNKTKPSRTVIFDIEGGVTQRSLEIVVKYMYNLLYPSEHSFDFEAEFLQLEPYSILNLIQAAHSLRLKNLMDLTCKRLADKVMTDVPTIEIYSKRKMILHKDPDPRKTLKRTHDMSPSGPQDSDKGCSPDEKAILRDRVIDNFVNESYFLDVHLSPMVTSNLIYVGYWVRRLESTFEEHFDEVCKFAELEQPTSASVNSMQLTIAILRLEEIIVGDPRFSSCLREHVVFYLVKLFNTGAYNLDIQCAVVSILSRANFDLYGDIMEYRVVPLLGKLVSEYTGILFHAAVSALTRLAYMFPDRIKVIVDDNAFQAVCKAFCKPDLDLYCLSKFLAAVCRGYRLSSDGFPSDKVETVLTILEDYQFTVTTNEDIHVFACYTLLHLSYGRSVALETKTWNKLIKRLIDLIYTPNSLPLHSTSLEYGSKKVMIIGSALGVIGNFIKWGSVQQIESLITEPDLLKSLRRVLSSKLRKFQMEGSRIISNLAARRTILGVIVSSGVVGCLCKLLENEDFEVKWEAAWAVINSIYGCGNHRKVEKCLEMEQAQ